MLHFHIITLFPESIQPYLNSSIIGRAQATSKSSPRGGRPKIKISFYNPKDFIVSKTSQPARTQDVRVDRKPYGGGPGMVLRPEPMLRAVQKSIGKRKAEIIFFSTDGKQFNEEMAKKFARHSYKGPTFVKHIVFVCGHYEGVDARVQKILKAKKISVGPYVLTGGELPAATMIDAISRHVPGVLGKAESLEASRVSSPEVYTRPEVLEWKKKKYRVPKVLLTGHHAKIEEWKNKKRRK